jgi:hypothetical protein
VRRLAGKSHFNPNYACGWSLHTASRVSKLKERLAQCEAELSDEFIKCELPKRAKVKA